MTEDGRAHHTTRTYTDHLESLQAACAWSGIDRGRASQYGILIRQFFEEAELSREHILAYNESCEIIDIYELWKENIDNFPNLDRKIRAVFSRGPILREDEKSRTSSNRPRNDAFAYLLAGMLIRAGIRVIAVDGIAAGDTRWQSGTDITFDWSGSVIDVECKRPQTRTAVEKRVREACQKLKKVEGMGRKGIVGVDCSAFIRPPGTVIEKDSAEEAETFLGKLLETEATREIPARHKPTILGFILFARAPAMIRKGHSTLLSPDGTPLQRYFRPESISTTLVVNNSHSSEDQVLRTVFRMLYRSLNSTLRK